MSAVDLTAAVEAAAVALYSEWNPEGSWSQHSPQVQHAWRERALPIVTAAAPLIEAAVREQAAREIEADLVRDDQGRLNTFNRGQENAARIARGGTS